MRIIITGATGMVGEGVLLYCLEQPEITEVLVIGRRKYALEHHKLKQHIVRDFFTLGDPAVWQGYDACFFCAGVSSIGKNESSFTHLTYDTTIAFAREIIRGNEGKMVFCYVSGQYTNTNGQQMWARVKGRTEEELLSLPFRDAYNFRPGIMLPVARQHNVRWFFYPALWIVPKLLPSHTLTLAQVGRAMMNTVTKGYPQKNLEIRDIAKLAAIK